MNTVVLEPVITSTLLESCRTYVKVELIDIYATYFWLYPAQAMVNYQEVGDRVDN